MSCQQAARLLTSNNTNATTRTREDPYVFTESVSSTPPILFNIQKSRTKISDTLKTTTKFTHQKLPLTQINGLATNKQTALENAFSIATAATITTTNFKNVSQSQQQQQNRKPTTTNACIVRQKQQQQQIQEQTQIQTSLPTPSLWQTPLLLETIVSPPTSPASLPSPTPASSATPNTSATLPPSNFHHTTFAQHLQKVGCIRKTPATHASKERFTQHLHAVQDKQQVVVNEVHTRVPNDKSQKPLQQHSDNELNDIPVNVIYRKPPQNTGSVGVIDEGKNTSKVLLKNDPNISLSSKFTAIHTQATVNVQSAAKKCELFSSSITETQSSSIADQSVPEPLSTLFGKPTPSKAEKCLQTDTGAFFSNPPKPSEKRKPAQPSAILTGSAKLQPQLQTNKKFRRACVNHTDTTAFAVVTCPAADSRNSHGLGLLDDTQHAPAYCVQQHWMGVYDLKAVLAGRGGRSYLSLASIGREERIEQHKHVLRRQAMQLLSMQKLLLHPLQVARRRLMCVDRLLRKHENHCEVDFSAKSCVLANCSNQALPMTTHCYAHVGFNLKQQLFLTCTAKFADNSQCRIPVFDIVHDLPLCTEHARKRDAYNRIWHEQHQRKESASTAASVTVSPKDDCLKRQQQQQQQQQQKLLTAKKTTYSYKNTATATKPPPQRNNKRKICSSDVIKPVGRPQKRFKRATFNVTPITTSVPPPLSAVKQRKSSNTSLESIASNSHSSHSQPPFPQSATTNVALAPPALAPLSGGNVTVRHHHLHQQQQHHQYEYISRVGASAAPAAIGGLNRMLNFGGGPAAASHEINQIVAQFAMVANDNNNSNSHTDFSSVLSSLPSADEILTQDMLSICENSSAYASSEDTGVGGLSETELMVGANDAEEIPLGDTRLLEEHDLANVLNTLPVDAFNELFTVVRQDERDEVERALEIADKHLKSLQQTIGSDSDFLGDFLNVNDHMLDDSDICSKMEIVSSVLNSPDTSGIDTATLFGVDGGGSNSGGGSCSNAVTDIRGLVQT